LKDLTIAPYAFHEDTRAFHTALRPIYGFLRSLPQWESCTRIAIGCARPGPLPIWSA
jgi:hypothetical protein